MRMPEPVLALIEYDFAQPPVQKYLYPVKSLRELRPDQCSPLCELDGDREWKLYTHLRPKEPGDYEHLELKLALKLLANTLLGFLALWCVKATAAYTGITLGLNLLNALVIGILGLPGFVLLLLTQWVL